MKEKTFRLILSMTFIFILLFSVCLSIQAYAEFNGDQGAGEQSANKFSNGISTAKQ
jgi:hypothetical protein